MGLKVEHGQLLLNWPNRHPIPGLAEELRTRQIEVAACLIFDGKRTGAMLLAEYQRRCPGPVPKTWQGNDDGHIPGHAAISDGWQEWQHVANRIVSGEFDLLDKSTHTSLSIGLRSFADRPEAVAALRRLDSIIPLRWRAADIKAGRLLDRKQRNNR